MLEKTTPLKRSVSGQSESKMLFYALPLRDQNAVHHAIPDRSIAAQRMMTEDAIFLCTQTFDRLLRVEIEGIGTKTHYFAAQSIKSMSKQQ